MALLNKDPSFHPVQSGLAAARQNLVPGLVIQTFLLILVLSYYFVPATRRLFETWAAFKDQWGLAYAVPSTAVFGGLIPFLYQKFAPATRKAVPWMFLGFYLVFWGYKGFEIDLLYHSEAVFFGSGPGAETVVPKVLFDQFVYNPVFAAPVQILAYHWMNSRYSSRAFVGFDWHGYLFRTIPTTLISTWGVWVPLVTLIYILPVPLQLPVSNLCLCFWVLVFSTLTRPVPKN